MKRHKGTENYEYSLTSNLSKRRKTVDQQAAEGPFNQFGSGQDNVFSSVAKSSGSSKSCKSSKSSTKSFAKSFDKSSKSSAKSSEKLNESTDILSESEKHDDFDPTKVIHKMTFFGFKIDFVLF